MHQERRRFDDVGHGNVGQRSPRRPRMVGTEKHRLAAVDVADTSRDSLIQ